MKRSWLAAAIATATLSALVGVGVAQASWLATASHPEVTITSGNLAIAEGSTITWAETTPAIPSQDRAGGTGLESLRGFGGVAGDEVEISVPVVTTLTGDNLAADLRARLDSGEDGPAKGIEVVGYRVVSAAGEVLAPSVGLAPMGEAVTLAELDRPGAGSFTVVVVVRWTASVLTYATDLDDYHQDAAQAGIPIRISLEQRR